MFNGADLLVSELKRRGVTWVSTLCGNGLNPFFVSCKKAGIRLIDTRNEQAAAYMADAYARLTGQVGVCAVSSGVAHSGALTGIANAFFDGSPVLLITGASAGYGAGRGAFQEYDQVALAAPICKYARCIYRASDISFCVGQAFASAVSGRPGPVHLTIPLDVLESEIEAPTMPGHNSGTMDSVAEPLPPDHLAQAVAMVEQSRKPLLIAGSGVFYGKGQHSLVKFSEKAMIPMVTPIWDRGVIDTPQPNFLGVIGAASGEPGLLEDADLIILAGTRVDYRIGYLRPPKVSESTRIIRIDRDVCQLDQGVAPALGIAGDLPSVFDLLAKAISDSGVSRHAGWLKEARERAGLFQSRWQGAPQALMSGWHIMQVIEPFLDGEITLLIDGGNIGQWAHMRLATNRYPSSWLTCGASGVVGWGLPGAMAARLAHPDKPVLLVSGDGSFGFTTTELESAVRQKLPFVAVVANDKTWGIAASVQYHRYGDEGIIATRLGSIHFDKIAEAYGAQGRQANNPQELTRAIQQGFSADVPVVIDVPTAPLAPMDIP